MASPFLSIDVNPDRTDPRMLEMKIHYLMAMMQKAGLLLGADGKNIDGLSADVQADADAIQSSFEGNEWKD
jgi:hypothetical protein